jgi:hypothetical protein
MKLKIIIIVLCVISLVLSIATEIRMIRFKQVHQASINRLSNNNNLRFSEIEKKMEEMEKYFEPGGIVEKYIVANDFLEKKMEDIDQIITSITSSSTEGYIQIYVIGHEDLWVAFRDKDGKYIFQGNLKPGLNPYKFYFFKTPPVDTRYTYTVSPDSSFTTGDKTRLFFLIQETGQTRLIKHPENNIQELKKDLNLYIP